MPELCHAILQALPRMRMLDFFVVLRYKGGMKISCTGKWLLVAAVAVGLLSCGGGKKGEDPLAQPSSFVPDEVTEVVLTFSGGGGAIPNDVRLKQQTSAPEPRETEVQEWKADVESISNFLAELSQGKKMSCTLTGFVTAKRLDSNAGYQLDWSGEPGDSGKAAWNGTMLLHFYAVDDEAGKRYATVVQSDVVLGVKPAEEASNLPCPITGCNVVLSFTPPTKPKTE